MQKWKNKAYYYYYYIILYYTVEVEAAAGAAASTDTTSLHKHLGTFICCRHAPRGPCLSCSQNWMINAQQVYCHTLAYHTPTANRTLKQWRPQLATSTPLTRQTFIKTEAKFVPYKEYLEDQTKEDDRSETCSYQREMWKKISSFSQKTWREKNDLASLGVDGRIQVKPNFKLYDQA